MRSFSSLVLVLAVAACGGSDNNIGDDDVPPGDGPGGDANPNPDSPPPPDGSFYISTPPVDIAPGQEVTYCYYFHTNNTADIAVNEWTSHMTTGSHHMIFFTTPSAQQPDGTLSTQNCGLTTGGGGGGFSIPTWTYSAQTPESNLALPSNDGTGKPVAQILKANSPAFIQMHYLNTTDDVLHAHVELVGKKLLPDGADFTQAAPFVTFNTSINIPAGSAVDPSTASAAGSCTVSPSAKFYVMTTHAHKQAVETLVFDGGSVSQNKIQNGGTPIVDSTDWEHPLVKQWGSMPFFSFASGKLSYQCNYSNPNAYSIHEGDSAATDEMCMAVGYFFPGTSAKLCLNSITVN